MSMPTNKEFEKSVLGCILIENNKELQYDIIDALVIDDFYDTKNKLIFNTILNIKLKNILIDFIVLTDEFQKANLLESIGGAEYITELTNLVPSASNYMYYVNSLKEYSKKRILVKCANNIAENTNAGESSENVVGIIEKTLNEIDKKENAVDDETIAETANKEFTKIKNAINGIFDVSGLKTGYNVLDDTLYGLHDSDLFIIGARAGVGKTAFALDILNNVSLIGNKTSLFFSLEMPKEQIMHRLYSINTGISGNALNRGRLENGDFRKIEIAKDKISKSKLIINDNSSLTPQMMMKIAKHTKRNSGLDLIVVDYLQFVKPNNPTNNKFLDIGDVAKELKRMARELKVPVIALAQLNRALDKEDRLPVLADLRESGDIENNADVVLLMHSKANDMNDPRDTSFIIAKNRNGQRLIIRTKYYGSIFTFKEIEPKKVQLEQPPQKIQQGDEMPF